MTAVRDMDVSSKRLLRQIQWVQVNWLSLPMRLQSIMAGAFHGAGEVDVVINVKPGPGVVQRAEKKFRRKFDV